MILYKRKSSQGSENLPRFSNEPYLIINIIFAGVILMIIAFSGIFSPVNLVNLNLLRNL